VRWTAYAGLACLSFASVGVGLAAEPTLGWARAATAELIDPGRYRAAVLGGAGGEGDADGTPAEARALLGHRLGGVGGDGPADPTREVTR
jgi:hypothetical protein